MQAALYEIGECDPVMLSNRGKPNVQNSQARDPASIRWRSRRDKQALHHALVASTLAAWVVLVRVGPKHWERYGLKPWLETAKKRLHHNVLAVALANKLARIAWSVLAHGRAFEATKIQAA